MSEIKNGFILSESSSSIQWIEVDNLLKINSVWILPVQYEIWTERWTHPHCGNEYTSDRIRLFFENKIFTNKFYGKIFSSREEVLHLISEQINKLVKLSDSLKHKYSIQSIETDNSKLFLLF